MITLEKVHKMISNFVDKTLSIMCQNISTGITQFTFCIYGKALMIAKQWLM